MQVFATVVTRKSKNNEERQSEWYWVFVFAQSEGSEERTTG